MKTIAWCLSVSALALTWCGTAAAQTSPQSASDTRTSSTSDDSINQASDIVVTAERRTENLATTPISASVLSGADLANKGVVNVDALQFAMPSVVVNNFGQGNDFNIRGIGKAEHNTQTTTGVITYRDGVPTFPGYIQEEPYYDVANIQVLRGPQGTIVGQNATGGAVFVNTNDPIIDGGVHGYIQGQYGNYSDVGLQGAANLPISDTLAARVAIYSEKRDGFYHMTGPGGAPYRGHNGDLGEMAGRFSLLWKPSDNFSVLWKTDAAYLDLGGYPAAPYTQKDLFHLTANSPQDARDKLVRSSLKMDYTFANGIKFRSVSGIASGDTNYTADLDGTATGIETFFDKVHEFQFSQEFNLISPDDQRITWLAGAFGLWNTYTFRKPYQFVIDLAGAAAPGIPAYIYSLQGRNPERSLAVFGQVGFEITPRLKIEAGGRYTASRSTNHVDVMQYGAYIRDDQRVTSDNFSYKVSLGWKASATQYLYGFVATGFRPGGLNVPVGLGNPAPFKPERVTSYEAGWKGDFASGHLNLSFDGFYNDYKDFQVIVGYPTIPTFGFELNVPNTTRIYGAEAEANLHFGGFAINAGINVLHSELGQFYAVDSRTPASGLPSDPVLPCDPTTGPPSTHCVSLKGQEQTYAPNMTFNIGAQYELKLGDKDTITPRVNFGHVAAQWATLFENPALGDRLGERNVLNAQLAWAHGGLSLTAYATNLTNQHYAGALNSGLYFAGPPRQYGIKLLKVF
ncbi:TonB-dependent receptor [Hephaestia mangrovi]|uniref:TonB-dependent receptor n=1 Tax=Hephaestia mangrovi TaxID=2873268 RepID=UPI001CA62080|nr:TonB-dependent receptor [Hephaestia mangrovi]MBY8826514.1 TonB-dependent receptor [Hephaestia mangrovi]